MGSGDRGSGGGEIKMDKIINKITEGKREDRKSLEEEDKILNLKEIDIMDIDSFSSSSCSGRVSFCIDCETERGYCEDPNFTGKIEVLKINKEKDKIYNLKIKFTKEDE